MINPISSQYAAYTNQLSQPAVPQPKPQQRTSLPQDKVTLSSVDGDHDGDSK
jgi:hypothetical protein